MKIEVRGKVAPGITAKDIILAIIGKTTMAGGTGHVAVSYTHLDVYKRQRLLYWLSDDISPKSIKIFSFWIR